MSRKVLQEIPLIRPKFDNVLEGSWRLTVTAKPSASTFTRLWANGKNSQAMCEPSHGIPSEIFHGYKKTCIGMGRNARKQSVKKGVWYRNWLIPRVLLEIEGRRRSRDHHMCPPNAWVGTEVLTHKLRLNNPTSGVPHHRFESYDH